MIFQVVSLTPIPQSQFGPLTRITAGGMVGGFIKLALIIAAIVFLFLFIIGGIRWILSGGDKQAVESARSQLTSALVGLVIVFATWAVILIIQTLFCVNLLDFILPSILPGSTGQRGGC